MIGYSLTGTQDQGLTGEGLTTTFRELKPGTVDAMFDAFAPLRWCLFVEPVQVYRGRKARLEAVLANEDVLAPGDYPVRFQIVGPRKPRRSSTERSRSTSPIRRASRSRFAIPVVRRGRRDRRAVGQVPFSRHVSEGRRPPAGGEVEFYVADPAEMPTVDTEVVLWGDDAGWPSGSRPTASRRGRSRRVRSVRAK